MSPFAPLIGQPQAISLLTQAVAKHRIAPAYLFAGAVGVGRSLAARCFVELVLSHTTTPVNLEGLQQRLKHHNHPDLLWVEPTYLHQGKRLTAAAAEEAGVKRKSPPMIRLEQVREIAQFLSRPPLEASRSIVVLDQAETMAEAAANGLLKTLEEPGQATLILIAPSVESLLPTLVSRCQKTPFYRLSSEAMAQVLQQAGQAEILQQPQILQLAQGSPGAAIAHWQQLQTIPADLLQALGQPPRSPRAALTLARQIASTLESETQIWLLDYLQQWYWQTLPVTPATQSIVQQLEKARRYLQQFVQPRLTWEVTLLNMVQS
ncbi:DNA polymerase III subunit delta' [Pantanalinema sp. GBBB05]|uniref:DNA polymerase III subunit delta' n=1 Tax=Pantanalinema sp. GBBB05 TaxID=2604139 RepID=UPI001D97805B|nr:DNA polymerase III subunit delta' [Pantanalinema sp. GBBB05]